MDERSDADGNKHVVAASSGSIHTINFQDSDVMGVDGSTPKCSGCAKSIKKPGKRLKKEILQCFQCIWWCGRSPPDDAEVVGMCDRKDLEALSAVRPFGNGNRKRKWTSTVPYHNTPRIRYMIANIYK